MTYLPNVRLRVDWDNDSFLNGSVPEGTPPNRIPNAAYAVGAKAAYVIDNVFFDGEFKHVDDIGFTALETDFSIADSASYGFARGNYAAPVDSPRSWLNLADFAEKYFLDLKKLTPSTLPPTLAQTYGATGTSSVSFNVDDVFLATGTYILSVWVRMRSTATTPSITLAADIASSETGGVGIGLTGYSRNVLTGTANTWTTWKRIAYVAEVQNTASQGGSHTKITIEAISTSNPIEVEWAGLMLTEVIWEDVSMTNLSVISSSNGTITWNGSLGTTGGYELRGTTGGSLLASLDAAHNWNDRDYFVAKFTHTNLRVGSSTNIRMRIMSDHDLTDENPLASPTTATTYTEFMYESTTGLTADGTEALDIGFADSTPTPIGSGLDLYDLTLQLAVAPDVYYETPRIFAKQSDILMETGNAYNTSFHAKHFDAGVTHNVDVDVYGVSSVDGTLTFLETATFAITDAWARYAIEISTVAEDYGLYVEITSAYNDIMHFKGFQLTQGLSPVAFNVGEVAPYDDISLFAKSAQWKSGRNAFDDSIAYEGTLDITLNNEDRRFSMENVNSPLYGYLRQNLRVVVEVYHLGAWHALWSGWTRFFDVVAGTNSSLEVNLHAEQGVYRLREGSFSYVPTENTRMDEVIAAIVHNSGWRSARTPFHTILSFDAILGVNTYLQSTEEIFSRIDVGKQNLLFVGMDWGRETTPDKALEAVLSAEQAKLWIDREGGLVLVNRNHLINAEDSFTTDITLDTEVQDASYNYGEGILNRVQVVYQEKKEVSHEIIWQSKSPILVPKRDALNIYRRSTVRFPLHFTFEEQRQRTITKIYSRMSEFDYTVTNLNTGLVIDNTDRKIWISVTSDGGNRLELQIRNEFEFPVSVSIAIYGDYLEGGQGQVVIVEDTAAQEDIQAIHEKIVKTSVLSDLETAVNLAKWDISRYANPRGEFRVITTYVDSPEILTRLLAWPIGTILKVSEIQTGELDRFHIIIAEEGSYAAGDTLNVTHRMARGDDNYYNKVGYSKLQKGTLNHAPQIDIITADMFGSDGAKASKVSYISSEGDKAAKFESKKYGGAIWFGNNGAMLQHVIKRNNVRFTSYNVTVTGLTYQGTQRPFISKSYLTSTLSLGGTPIYPVLAFVDYRGSISTPANWFMLPRKRNTLMRFSGTFLNKAANTLNIRWDADTTNNLNSSSIGSITKSDTFTFTDLNSGISFGEGTTKHAVRDFILKLPATADKKMYVRLYSSVSSTLAVTDPVEIDMTKIKNTTLKANTEYYLTLWAGAELGEEVEIEAVIVEHQAAVERVIPLTIGVYGKYQDTFTTSSSLADPTVSVFFRIKAVNTPIYVTGFAITEADVNSISEANTRQLLAAHSFI